jgi:hypothetical protein
MLYLTTLLYFEPYIHATDTTSQQSDVWYKKQVSTIDIQYKQYETACEGLTIWVGRVASLRTAVALLSPVPPLLSQAPLETLSA